MNARWIVLACALACACHGKKKQAPVENKTADHPVAASKLGRAIDVAVSQSDVCAALASGQAACWGELQGVLDRIVTEPQIVAGVTGATAIANNHCVLRGAKAAMCWDSEGKVTEIAGTEGARQIAEHDLGEPCFLLASGSVSCWKDAKLVPEKGLTGLRAIDNWAYNEWCYVRESGEIGCSGEHETDLGKTLPTFADATGVVRVEQSIACVTRKSGELSCFGIKEGGADTMPKRGDQIFLAGGVQCVRAGADVQCRPWGADASWQTFALDGKATDLSCEDNTCCAVTDDGRARCWGDNKDGRLADGMPAWVATPTKIEGEPAMAAVYAGERFTVAVSKDRALYAWGTVGKGPVKPERVLGDVKLAAISPSGIVVARDDGMSFVGGEENRWETEPLPALRGEVKAIAMGDTLSICASLTDGTLRCIREDPKNEEDGMVWKNIPGMHGLTQLSAVGPEVCGVTKDGGVACMMPNNDEDEDAAPPTTGEPVPGIKNAKRVVIPYVELTDGTYVLIERDEHKHWKVTPQPELTGITGLETGGYGWSPTCGIKEKRALCWFAFGGGDDPLGKLARVPGSKVPTGTPAPVTGSIEATAVSAGNSHACLLDDKGAIWCWGDDREGELGRGRVLYRETAAPVTGIGP